MQRPDNSRVSCLTFADEVLTYFVNLAPNELDPAYSMYDLMNEHCYNHTEQSNELNTTEQSNELNTIKYTPHKNKYIPSNHNGVIYDLRPKFKTGTLEYCKKECTKSNDCTAFTYGGGYCYLKNSEWGEDDKMYSEEYDVYVKQDYEDKLKKDELEWESDD